MRRTLILAVVILLAAAWALSAYRRAPSLGEFLSDVAGGMSCGALIGLGIANLRFGFVEGSNHRRMVENGVACGAALAVVAVAIFGTAGGIGLFVAVPSCVLFVIGATLFRYFRAP